jgi:hypothetical protein
MDKNWTLGTSVDHMTKEQQNKIRDYCIELIFEQSRRIERAQSLAKFSRLMPSSGIVLKYVKNKKRVPQAF